MGVELYLWSLNLSSITTSASANAASGSPNSKVLWLPTLDPTASCSKQASDFRASSGSRTTGRGSYSTWINSAASSATYRFSATTTATGSPTYRTLSTAIQHNV